MYGKEVYRRFCSRIGQSYSKFRDITKLNRTFLDALYDVTQNKSEALTQKEYDELCFQIKTEKVLSVKGNKIPLSPIVIDTITANGNVLTILTIADHNLQANDSITITDVQGIFSFSPVLNGVHTVGGVPTANTFELSVGTVLGFHLPRTGYITHDRMLTDYLHLFSARFKGERRLSFNIMKVTQGGVIELSKRNNLRDADLIRIDEYPSLPVLVDNWYVKQLTDKKIKLYRDEKLLIPAPVNTISNISGGVLYQGFYKYGEPLTSDQKIGEFVRGSSDNAKYETAEGMLKIYPRSENFIEATLDYYAKPKQVIDLDDAVIDLELYYPHRLLTIIIEDAAIKWAQGARDTQGEQGNTRQLQQNN